MNCIHCLPIATLVAIAMLKASVSPDSISFSDARWAFSSEVVMPTAFVTYFFGTGSEPGKARIRTVVLTLPRAAYWSVVIPGNFSGSFFESLIKRLDKIERRLARIEKKLPGEK